MTEKIVLEPNKEWFICHPESPLKFPPLHYEKVSQIVPSDKLKLGGSWSTYYYLPHYLERCEIFAEQYMPYSILSKYFQVFNGELYWPMLNLYSFTDIKDPRKVYVKKGMRDSDPFVAEFRFLTDKIEMYELE